MSEPLTFLKDSQTGKTSPIRLIAVRETGVSRHQGGPIEGPPETPRTSQHYRTEGGMGRFVVLKNHLSDIREDI